MLNVLLNEYRVFELLQTHSYQVGKELVEMIKKMIVQKTHISESVEIDLQDLLMKLRCLKKRFLRVNKSGSG
jgi:hypothetical protein